MLARDIADALMGEASGPDLRLRKGTVETGGGTTSATVFLGGSAVSVPVVFPKNAPANGAVCWVLQQGPLLLGLF